MSWTDIVNKGSDSWWIVSNNQPAAAGSFCNAAPDVDDWNTLSDGWTGGWPHHLRRKIPIGLFDMEIPLIDIEWYLHYEYGNQYRRKGMFLRSITTSVQKCEVAPGFDVSIGFKCGTPMNDNPSSKPPWPTAIVGFAMWAQINTPKWQKVIDKWKYSLNYNGSLVPM